MSQMKESIIEVDGVSVRVFLSDDDVIFGYILPDSRVEHWKSRMNEVKATRGETVWTEEMVERIREKMRKWKP